MSPLKYIDFVLVWETPTRGGGDQGTTAGENADSDEEEFTKKRKSTFKKIEHDNVILQKRRIFEQNLEEEGLRLERESLEGSRLHFVKIQASTEVLSRYAEIMRLRMPMKEMEQEATTELVSSQPETPGHPQLSRWSRTVNWFQKQFDYDRFKFPPLNQRLTAIYSRDKDYLFDVDDKDFFTQSMRSSIVDFIIKRKRYSEDPFDDFAFGIERLINDKVYCAAYPLHDGELRTPGGQRHLLYTEWAMLRNCLKAQPLDHIKEYFGVNVGLYFAWLGFYTRMLIPASVLGIFCFIYGIGTVFKDEYSTMVCNDGDKHIMCPLCSGVCQYWRLNTTCVFAKFTYVFDNHATIIFAVIMSFWAAIFLEFWKRYSAQITHKWDLSTLDITEEQPRLEYLSRLKRLKKLSTDVVNTNTEPHVSFWKTKVPFQLLSISAVLFLVTLAGAVILGVIVFRVTMIKVYDKSIPKQSMLLMSVSASAAMINLVIICIFNLFFRAVAQYFTEMELHRTQTEFDDALTLKIFMLQFINYYSSIFYIAFFKGRFTRTPDQPQSLLSAEKCGAAGCMSDLCIQLVIIMIGKQFIGGVLEMTTPIILKWVTHFNLMVSTKRKKTRRPAFSTQWAKDYKLAGWNSRSLFGEYLEMIIQYGFVTIFVAAFPLAPLFALLNNVLEMRLDATKMLMYNRRPVGQRSKSIGIWYGILDTISRIAVISNALIIAFTSNFIPKMVYYFEFVHGQEEQKRTPFFDYSLVPFNTTRFHESTKPKAPSTSFENATKEVDRLYYTVQENGTCWNQGLDDGASKDFTHKDVNFYWKVVVARLIFVLVFQNVVSMCVLLLKVLIPDVPKKLQKQIRHENHLTSEIIIKQEMLRARKESERPLVDGDDSVSPTPQSTPDDGDGPSAFIPQLTVSKPSDDDMTEIPLDAPASATVPQRDAVATRKSTFWTRCTGGGDKQNSGDEDETYKSTAV